MVEQPARLSFRDPRVLPYLVTGFVVFLGFSAVATIIGFAVQDRFGLPEPRTAAVTAGLLLIVSIVMALVQGGLVRKLDWQARRLLRVGLSVMTVAAVLLLLDAPLWVLGAGCLLLGIGSGLAMPGYTAGPTLETSPEEQGGLAGLVNANNGLTYVIAPIASTSLYGLQHSAPFVGVLVLFAAGLVFTLCHPVFRRNPVQGDAE